MAGRNNRGRPGGRGAEELYYDWRPHPWHGLSVGPDPPAVVSAYIEITPFDLVKYEIDKRTGHLRIDRPQRSSSLPPSLYGFVPRTYCGEAVGRLNPASRGGDGDPLDICVLSERPIRRAEIILDARVVGGIRTLDHGLADDKIVAVMKDDAAWGGIEDLRSVPLALVQRLGHYFATYKLVPGHDNPVRLQGTYSRRHAFRVIRAAQKDYDAVFGRARLQPAGRAPRRKK